MFPFHVDVTAQAETPPNVIMNRMQIFGWIIPLNFFSLKRRNEQQSGRCVSNCRIKIKCSWRVHMSIHFLISTQNRQKDAFRLSFFYDFACVRYQMNSWNIISQVHCFFYYAFSLLFPVQTHWMLNKILLLFLLNGEVEMAQEIANWMRYKLIWVDECIFRLLNTQDEVAKRIWDSK